MKTKKLYFVFVIFTVLAFVLAACGPATSTASCAFIVGNGVYDRKLKEIVYPGQEPSQEWSNSTTQYFPCNARNYMVTDGAQSDVAGQLGDRPWAISMNTPSGTPILVSATAFWTLNQDPKAMQALFTVFEKYDVTTSSETQDGKVNASTPGWNKMLSENFGPTMDAIAKIAGRNITVNPPLRKDGTPIIFNDNSYVGDTEQYAALANEMSSLFASDVSKRLGFDFDLFCGSGLSRWMDPENPEKTVEPGKGTYFCAPVRIEVNDIVRNTKLTNNGSEGLADANQQRYDSAYKLYGEQTSCWLGILDAIEMCKGSSSPCSFIIDSSACSTSPSDKGNTLILPNYPATPTTEAPATPKP